MMTILKELRNKSRIAACGFRIHCLRAMTRVGVFVLFTLAPSSVFAQWAGYNSRSNNRCGAVDYSWDLDGLSSMVMFVTRIMTAVLGIVYSIGAILSIVSATNIYVKMNTGEEGFTKNVIMLIGAIIFMLTATIVLPAFFGWTYDSGQYGTPH